MADGKKFNKSSLPTKNCFYSLQPIQDGRGRPKSPPPSFSPVTFTNIGISP